MKRTKHTPTNTILCCDPSFTAWGWAVVQDNEVVRTGCIKTKPEAKKRRIREGDDRVRRTAELTNSLLTIIYKYNIRIIVAELPHGSQNAKAAVMMGVVLGVLQGIAETLCIPIEWFSEGDAKKSLLDRLSATKQEIIDAIETEYDITLKGPKYQNEAIADALAIHNVAKKHSTAIKMLS